MKSFNNKEKSEKLMLKRNRQKVRKQAKNLALAQVHRLVQARNNKRRNKKEKCRLMKYQKQRNKNY